MSGMTLTAMMVIVAGVVTMSTDPAMSRLSAPKQVPPLAGGPFVNAGIGNCSTDFAVKDGAGQPIVGAKIQMHLRYGLMGLRQMDLAVGTGQDGHARIDGLPEGAWLLYDIDKGKTTTQVHQDLRKTCRGRYDVTLK
jgi:hypothetical protein